MSAVANQPKWYGLTVEHIAQQLQVDPAKGLSTAEAQQRLQTYGPNWLICIGVAVVLLLVDEVIKIFLRQRRSQLKTE